MGEWKTAHLGEACQIKYGKDHKHLADGKIPVYGSGGVMRHVNTALYEKKSVLIPRKGSLENLFFVETPFWSVDTLFYTEIDEEKVTPEFLFYQLKTFDLAGMNVGTAVPSLTTAVLNEIEVVIPPLKEQIEIGRTLRALDDKIANNTAINHHLSGSMPETDSSPDIRQGKRVSRNKASLRLSTRLFISCSYSEAISPPIAA